ncbi:MAG: adenylate/guanylate cyclase domain-containing protein [Alphaproteobacteria bacterium]|nr:adenylate/guanylate cyclase domain-containing protein [Alphaproteobacteria bacterium]MCB9930425.1 adenylate/guanylate cyclase domain-containing protein [Alphaproteobacteria bacterium]
MRARLPWQRRLVVMAMGLLALALALALRWFDPGPLIIARHLVFDQYQLWQPRVYAPAPVRVITIDEDSLARLGQWPWPRHYIAQMIDNLTEMGAAAIAFDIIFAEPDRTSPDRVVADWSMDQKHRQEIEPLVRDLPDHDELLRRAIASSPTVLGMILKPGDDKSFKFQRKAGFAGHQDVIDRIPKYGSASRNLLPLEEAASGIANFGYTPERDGIVRRIPLLGQIHGVVLPTISIEALRVAQNASTIIARSAEAAGEDRFGTMLGLNLLRVGQIEVPMTADSRFWVHYTRPMAEREVPAWKILQEPNSVIDKIEGQIVLIGATAPGLRDLRATPFRSDAPGILIHAQALEQMILGDFLLRPGWANAAEFLGLAVLGLIFAMATPWLGPMYCALIGIVIAAGGAYASWFAYANANLLVDPLYATLAALIVYLVVTATQYVLSERERTRVRSTFGRYLSPALVQRMADSGEDPQLGGVQRQLTLMFCDIRGFTPISESMTPFQLTQFINKFLTPMTDTILSTGGTIDKYMGDAIMAFWNAPLDEPQHASRAVHATLQMRERLRVLEPQWRLEAEAEGRELPPVRIGMGINTGDCVVGNVGSDQRFDYSCLGDTVNTASRLEGQSKTYGVDLVVGEDSVELAPGFAYLELDLIRVKGKQNAVRIFTVLGGADLAETPDYRALKAHHEAVLAAYRAQDWAEAIRLIEIRERAAVGDLPGGLDGLYAEYLARIRELVDEPPGSDWDGVYEAKSK